MKKILDSQIEKIEFFIYYIFMIFFCFFLSINCFFYGHNFLIFSFLSGTCAFLSLIILISYYRAVFKVLYLLKVFIIILLLLFLGSAIVEAIIYNFHLYIIIMKASLYGFCFSVPIKHYIQLRNKFNDIR